MPLTHIRVDGVEMTPEEALEHVAERDDGQPFTYELLSAILATQQARDYISTTVITAKCLRSTVLQRQVPYTEDVEKLWASFRGTMFHGQLEKHVHPECIEEPRFFIELDGLGELSGSPDLVDPTRGILYDYKFTKENPRFDRPWPDHVKQCQINRWLVDNAHKVVWRGKEYALSTVSPMAKDQRAVARNRKKFVPIDWQDLIVVYMDDRGPKPLRCFKSIDVPKVNGEGTKRARVADIWDDETVEALVRERYAEAKDCLESGHAPAIPEGWEHQSHPLCGYCPVRATCARLEREESA